MSSENNDVNSTVADKPIKVKKTNGRKWAWITAVVLIAVALGVVFGLKLFAPKPIIVTKNYGKIAHLVTFDQNNISEEEVNYLAEGLTKANFFDEARPKYVYIKNTNAGVEISISCNPAINSNPSAIKSFVQLRADMQKQFSHNKIIINLIIDKLDNVIKRIE
jgi:hypothetical protein